MKYIAFIKKTVKNPFSNKFSDIRLKYMNRSNKVYVGAVIGNKG